MWQALVIALLLAVVLLLGLAVLQRAEFRSVFRRRTRPPPDHMAVRHPQPRPPSRDSPPAAP